MDEESVRCDTLELQSRVRMLLHTENVNHKAIVDTIRETPGDPKVATDTHGRIARKAEAFHEHLAGSGLATCAWRAAAARQLGHLAQQVGRAPPTPRRVRRCVVIGNTKNGVPAATAARGYRAATGPTWCQSLAGTCRRAAMSYRLRITPPSPPGRFPGNPQSRWVPSPVSGFSTESHIFSVHQFWNSAVQTVTGNLPLFGNRGAHLRRWDPPPLCNPPDRFPWCRRDDAALPTSRSPPSTNEVLAQDLLPSHPASQDVNVAAPGVIGALAGREVRVNPTVSPQRCRSRSQGLHLFDKAIQPSVDLRKLVRHVVDKVRVLVIASLREDKSGASS